MNSNGDSTQPTRTALLCDGEELREEHRYVLDPATFWSTTPRIVSVGSPSSTNPATETERQKDSQSSVCRKLFHDDEPSTPVNPGPPPEPKTPEKRVYEPKSIYRRNMDEISTLREEIKQIHITYRKDIGIHQKHIHSQSTHIKDLEEMVNNRTSEIVSLETSLKGHALHSVNLVKTIEAANQEKEKWIGLTLKFQYLFQQMDKIGLKQSEDIFDCFRDIDVPEVCVHIKERFVPTELTNAFSDDDSEDDLSLDDDSEDDIIGDYFDNSPPLGVSLQDDNSLSVLQDIIGLEDENDEEDENDDELSEIQNTIDAIEQRISGDDELYSQALNILPDEHSDRITQQHHINLMNFNRREHTYSETYEFWTFYIEKGILDTITWPTDHLQLAAERYSLDIPDMPRTLQIHLVELCMRGEADLGWYELITKVITIQRIFRGHRVRKPWIDVAFP